jgi:hypothetical protein
LFLKNLFLYLGQLLEFIVKNLVIWILFFSPSKSGEFQPFFMKNSRSYFSGQNLERTLPNKKTLVWTCFQRLV